MMICDRDDLRPLPERERVGVRVKLEDAKAAEEVLCKERRK